MRKLYIVLAVTFHGLLASGQSFQDKELDEVTLQQAVEYSLKHQPVIQQSLIDQDITEANIRNRLADWYPQVNFNYNFQHNFKVQTTVIGENIVQLGVNNTSSLQFTASQALFNRDLLLASQT